MNFPQKYNLKVSTRFGKNYVTIEDAANVVHDLEQTIQFLRLDNNKLSSDVSILRENFKDEKVSFHELVTYYRESRDEAWHKMYTARIEHNKRYDRAIAALCFTITISSLLILYMFTGY